MKKVNLALIASGSGTDANSIMEASVNKWIPEVESKLLISTRLGAGCLEKANNNYVSSVVVDHKESRDQPSPYLVAQNFSSRIEKILFNNEINLVFLVGCIHKILPSDYYSWYNIHPADPHKHGGDNMYGLVVHEHVLAEIYDLIYRGRANITDRFFTYPTVHEVTDEKYDTGHELLQQTVEIPYDIIKDFVESKKDTESVCKRLQDHVLPYEHLMLPNAVRIAAKRIIDKKVNKK